jgi:hypothetical protein
MCRRPITDRVNPFFANLACHLFVNRSFNHKCFEGIVVPAFEEGLLNSYEMDLRPLAVVSCLWVAVVMTAANQVSEAVYFVCNR